MTRPRHGGLRVGAIALAVVTGCASIGRRTVGDVPPAPATDAIVAGASVGDVLARLGAPLEYWLAPDGLLVIWREQRYDYDRLELNPAQGLSVIAIDPILSSVLSNLRLTLERGRLDEARVAILFDRDGRVIAVARRDGGRRPLR